MNEPEGIDNLSNQAGYEKPAATCILCGELLADHETVRYQGWVCHAECTQTTVKERKEGFASHYFVAGMLGGLLTLFISLIIIFAVVPIEGEYVSSYFLEHNVDYTLPAIASIGIMCGFLLQSIGLVGFNKNYDQREGLFCAVLAMASAIVYGVRGVLILDGALLPGVFDEITGVYKYVMIPGYSEVWLMTIFLIPILSISTAILVWLIEKELGIGIQALILGVAFFIIALMPYAAVMYSGLAAYLFYNSGFPKEWAEVAKGL